MSKASIAQEPSMDEILASIRRIIETGEDKNGASVARSPFRDATLRAISPVVLPAEPDGSRAAEARGFEASHNAASEPETALATAPEPAVSDDDHLTAQLETELAATWSEIGAAQAPLPAEDTASAPADEIGHEQGEASMNTGSQGGWAPFAASIEPAEPETAQAASGSATIARDEPLETVAATFQPANTDRPGLLPLEQVSADRSYDYRGSGEALLSERPGTLVASSFEELAQAIRNGELRSIEAMAQDMLRPMLREWLDDNLPHMVERLVREEIERMARGGRR